MTTRPLLRRSALSAAVLLALAPSAFAADYIFSSGNYVPGTTAPEPLLAGDVLQINAGGFKYFSGITFVNQSGLVNWNADSLYLQSGAVIDNRAVWDAKADNTLANNGGATSTFDNSGTFRKSGGLGTTTIGSIAFVNSGIIDAQTGTIAFSGGNATFNAGSQFIGAGATVVSNNAAFNGAFTASNLSLTAGTFSGNAARIQGNLGFNGGTFSGTWEVANGQTLSGRDGGFKYLSGAGTVLTNKGTIDWGSGNSLYMQSSAVLDNQGLFVANESMTVAFNGGAASTFSNEANGTVRAAAGKTLNVGGIAFTNNGGTLDAAAGGSIVYGGGNATFNAGTRFTGTGSNVVTANARFIDTFTSDNLRLQSGIFTGGDGVTPGSRAELTAGTAAFTGGTLNGSWQFNAGSTVAAGSGGFKYVSGAATVVANQGNLAWATSDSLYVQAGARVENQATFDFQADGGVAYNGGSAVSFVNTGLIVKTGGSGTSTIGNGLGFDNQGVVDVRTGTIRLPDNFTNNGTLQGVGAFTTNVLTNAGHVAPGGAPGTLTLNGGYVQTAAGFLDIELASSALFDAFIVNGAASLGGTLALSCVATCDLHDGDVFTILDASGELTGTFAATTGLNFGKGFEYDVIYDYGADLVKLQVIHAGVVPEPETLALTLAGLGLVGGMARRRRALG